MKDLLKKDLRLTVSPLTWFFLAAAGMTMLPGYPILVGAFFVCLGIFYTFQNAREANDTLYTVLLPVRKRDFVAAKYVLVCFFELLAFAGMALLTVLRMTLLANTAAYVQNALMNATPFYLAFVLLVFTAFNVCFLGGFFKTAYAFGRPFFAAAVLIFLLIALGEALHHFPGLAFLNTPGGERLGVQLAALAAAAGICAAGTALSCRVSMARFERIDL